MRFQIPNKLTRASESFYGCLTTVLLQKNLQLYFEVTRSFRRAIVMDLEETVMHRGALNKPVTPSNEVLHFYFIGGEHSHIQSDRKRKLEV